LGHIISSGNLCNLKHGYCGQAAVVIGVERASNAKVRSESDCDLEVHLKRNAGFN
jgi:hypothetical protein